MDLCLSFSCGGQGWGLGGVGNGSVPPFPQFEARLGDLQEVEDGSLPQFYPHRTKLGVSF